MTKFLVADTETASLKGGVCDLAVVEIDKDFNVLHSVESLIDPECKISPSAMGIHHITNEMVWAAPTMDEFVAMNGNPFDHDDVVVIGHKIEFDINALKAVLPPKFRTICTLKLCRQLYPESENHQLQTMRYTFDLEAGESHRAMGDVITCLSLLRHISKDTGDDAFGLLARMSQPISIDMRMPFGKHRDERLRDLPSGYVTWCLKQDDFDPEIQAALRSHFRPGN